MAACSASAAGAPLGPCPCVIFFSEATASSSCCCRSSARCSPAAMASPLRCANSRRNSSTRACLRASRSEATSASIRASATSSSAARAAWASLSSSAKPAARSASCTRCCNAATSAPHKASRAASQRAGAAAAATAAAAAAGPRSWPSPLPGSRQVPAPCSRKRSRELEPGGGVSFAHHGLGLSPASCNLIASGGAFTSPGGCNVWPVPAVALANSSAMLASSRSRRARWAASFVAWPPPNAPLVRRLWSNWCVAPARLVPS
mmetsp:Transcript_39475/g.125488  ORF Transcript_39475/g.125488 Transcript_39475/m.125488 type:complete len:262 (-) Transcript_39475:30-815(-)